MIMTIRRRATRARRGGGTKAAAGLLALGFAAGWDAGTPAEAKTPGSTYCFLGVCHRVKTLHEMEGLVGKHEQLHTSFYDSCKRDRFNPCGLTSSGEEFRPGAPDNAASPIYPDGTMLLLWYPETEQAAVVRVNNAGPYWGARKLDVSRATAEKLGFKGRGTAHLHVEVVKAPNPGEAIYRRNRQYEPVPGHIGRYESVEAARAGMNVVMALQAIATSVFAPITGGALLEAGDGQAANSSTVAAAAALAAAARKTETPTRTAEQGNGRRKVAGSASRTRTAAATSRSKARVASNGRTKVVRSGKTRVATSRTAPVAQRNARVRTAALSRPASRELASAPEHSSAN